MITANMAELRAELITKAMIVRPTEITMNVTKTIMTTIIIHISVV